MASPTILAAGVGKRFLLHHRRATSLKERLLLHPDCGFATFADNPICSGSLAEGKLTAIARACAIGHCSR